MKRVGIGFSQHDFGTEWLIVIHNEEQSHRYRFDAEQINRFEGDAPALMESVLRKAYGEENGDLVKAFFREIARLIKTSVEHK